MSNVYFIGCVCVCVYCVLRVCCAVYSVGDSICVYVVSSVVCTQLRWILSIYNMYILHRLLVLNMCMRVCCALYGTLVSLIIIIIVLSSCFVHRMCIYIFIF